MVPGAIALSEPVVLIVPTAVLLLLHVPPGVASDNGVDAPEQSELSPTMGDKAFTVTVANAKHPPGNV